MEERDGEFAVNARTTDKYCLRVRDAAEKGSPFEVKVLNDPQKIITTVSYIRAVFQRRAAERVSIKAVGQAIPKAVRIAEIVKHSLFDLHQLNKLSNVEVEDVYVPLEEGLDEVVVRKKISVLEIVLMMNADEEVRQLPGYQPPLERRMVRPARRAGYRPRVSAREGETSSQPLRTVRVRSRRGRFDFEPQYDRRGFRGRAAPPHDDRPASYYGFEPRGAWRGSAPFQSTSRAAPPGLFRVRGSRGPMPYYRPRVAPLDRYDSYY